MKNYKCGKVLAVVLPLLVLTGAAASGLATAAWRAGGVATILAWVDPRSVSVPAPQASRASLQEALPLAVALDTAVMIELPAAAPAPVQAPLEPEPEPEAVDYERLNQDVQVVAQSLERFNQKLLRMIAQARAVQAQNERAKAAAGTGAGPDSSAHQAEPAPVTDSGSEPSG
jgi:hypothetical protein